MQELRRYPTRRCQELVEFDDGSRKCICYSNNCPHFYQDEKGGLRPIDLAIREKQNGKVGKHHVRDRHVVSVGHRDDGNHAKFLAFRPDVNQALGTEQLEFSLDAVKFGGVDQTTDLSKNEKADNLTTRLGSVLVRSTRQRTRQLIRVDRPITSFEIRYTLHVKGLTVVKRFGEFWFFGKDKEFRFRIRKPCLCGTNFQPLTIDGELVEHHLADNGDGTYIYTKVSTEAFGKAKLPAEYHVDADTYYSSTADGRVRRSAVEDWDTIHDAGSGTRVDDSAVVEYVAQIMQPPPAVYESILIRSFFYFDTSGATSPSSIDLKIYGYALGGLVISAQKGTQSSTLAVGDYDAFSGSEYGYKSSWSTSGYNSISFNSTGVNDVNTTGTTKICCRDRTYDYLDSDPGVIVSTGSDGYYADQTGTDKDPYLEITEGSAPSGNPFFYYHHTMLGT